MDDFEDSEEPTTNLLITTLREQGKTDAIALLKINTELNELVESTQFWYYKKVTPEEYQQVLDKANALKVGKDLSKRLTFLKMRILARLNADDAMMRLWTDEASRWEPMLQVSISEKAITTRLCPSTSVCAMAEALASV